MVAQVVFGLQRWVTEHTTGRLTGWAVNAGGAALLLGLLTFYRRSPDEARRRLTLHLGLVVCATCLVVPVRYGMVSSPWWLTIMPLAASFLISARAGLVWAVLSALGVTGSLIAQDAVLVSNAAGETLVEAALSRVFLVGLLCGVAFRARTVLDDQAQSLARAAAVLTESNRALKEANSAKTTFLANVSHELRTPISGVMGMTQLALDERLPGDAREYVQTAHQCAANLLGVINDILDVSRVEAGRLNVDAIPFSLPATLAEALSPLSVLASNKGLELLTAVHPDVAVSRLGDPTRVRQIVTNLVGNAIKFTQQGHVRVVVEPGPEPAGVAIRVEDTGIGIAPDDIQRLFTPFTQADDGISRRFGGTGLGLAISRELARRLGGDIRITSQLGVGSTFTVVLQLPVVSRAPDAEGARAVLVMGRPALRDALEPLLAARGIPIAWTEDHATLAHTTSAFGRAAVLLDAGRGAAEAAALLRSMGHEGPLIRVGFGATAGGTSAYDAELALPVFAETLAEALATPPREVVPEAATAVRGAPAAGAPCVLLIEDEQVNRVCVTRFLERAGYRVVCAEDGLDGLDRLGDGTRFVCVVTDVQMPRMDGLEFTRTVRARGIELPIVALTAHAMQGDSERILAAGVDAYLPKPVNAGALAAQVERLRRQARSERAARAAA